MQVVEHFVSINGEGMCAGELAVFIRFRGCNLHCSYCDTQWANHVDTPFTEMSVEEIGALVQETGIHNVTLTGGEPLLQESIRELVNILLCQGNRVEIETNGSISLAGWQNRPVFTMDYKLPSSGMEQAMCRDNFFLLEEQDTVKFVSGSRQDLERAKEIIEQYDLCRRCHVLVSPVFGRIDPADMVEWLKDNRLNHVRLQLQLHKCIWEPNRRGV